MALKGLKTHFHSFKKQFSFFLIGDFCLFNSAVVPGLILSWKNLMSLTYIHQSEQHLNQNVIAVMGLFVYVVFFPNFNVDCGLFKRDYCD